MNPLVNPIWWAVIQKQRETADVTGDLANILADNIVMAVVAIFTITMIAIVWYKKRNPKN